MEEALFEEEAKLELQAEKAEKLEEEIAPDSKLMDYEGTAPIVPLQSEQMPSVPEVAVNATNAAV